ncbi:crossover junction endodeoxyribonuclease RuvC [Patescibacteria group bacterium]|nr:crossover junction endodeoxyribonuclease RuvC [Patescibacteria group bacterium]
MIILGIDPGIATTGYGLINFSEDNKLALVDYGTIKTPSKKEFPLRLLDIYNELEGIIKKYNPDKIGIENIYFAKNVKTAINVGQARGVLILVSARTKAEILEITPLQVKQGITGYGQASKQQVQKMVKLVLGLDKVPRPDDAADALAIAIVCSQRKTFN